MEVFWQWVLDRGKSFLGFIPQQSCSRCFTLAHSRQLVLEQDWESSCCGMMTLDFGASEAELTMRNCWHMECRWEQAAVVV